MRNWKKKLLKREPKLKLKLKPPQVLKKNKIFQKENLKLNKCN